MLSGASSTTSTVGFSLAWRSGGFDTGVPRNRIEHRSGSRAGIEAEGPGVTAACPKPGYAQDSPPVPSPRPRPRPRIAWPGMASRLRTRRAWSPVPGGRCGIPAPAGFPPFRGRLLHGRGTTSNRLTARSSTTWPRPPWTATAAISGQRGRYRADSALCREPWHSSGGDWRQVPGFPYLLADNRSGLDAALEYLIRDHAISLSAGIHSGAAGNPDSDERELAFRQKSEAHGIALREELLLPGNFYLSLGVQAVRELSTSGA